MKIEHKGNESGNQEIWLRLGRVLLLRCGNMVGTRWRFVNMITMGPRLGREERKDREDCPGGFQGLVVSMWGRRKSIVKIKE